MVSAVGQGPLRLSLRAGFLEKREKGRTHQLSRFILTKDKPGVYFPVKVAHPPVIPGYAAA
jgi:hypothetical protein